MASHVVQKPRPAMSFGQQAELVDSLVERVRRDDEGGAWVTIDMRLDGAQVDDLVLLSRRLRRMEPYEYQIKKLVTGK